MSLCLSTAMKACTDCVDKASRSGHLIPGWRAVRIVWCSGIERVTKTTDTDGLTDGTEPVVDGDQYDVLIKQVFGSVEGPCPRHETAPVKPHHHVQPTARECLQTQTNFQQIVLGFRWSRIPSSRLVCHYNIISSNWYIFVKLPILLFFDFLTPISPIWQACKVLRWKKP